MENLIVEFDENKAFVKANKYFIKICGLQNDNKRHREMLSVGMDARKRGLAGIRIKAVISSYEPEVFHNSRVNLRGAEFFCPAFERLEQRNVKKIYAYALTAGECQYSDQDDILWQVFSDIWGTAYTDSARDLLEEYIKLDLEKEFAGQLGSDIFLSDAFGPGFYGMDVRQTNDLFRILDAGSIGMQVRDSGIMLPLKSCSGLYFAVSNPQSLPHPDCRGCIGSHMGCSFCKFRPVNQKQ